jgi:hypothetical protein
MHVCETAWWSATGLLVSCGECNAYLVCRVAIKMSVVWNKPVFLKHDMANARPTDHPARDTTCFSETKINWILKVLYAHDRLLRGCLAH